MANNFNDSRIIEYERQLLGSYIFGAAIGEGVSESVFLTTGHRIIFPIIRELRAKGLSIDIMILVTELEKRGKLDAAGGIDYVANLTTAASSANAEFYENEVMTAYRRRTLLKCYYIGAGKPGKR